MNLTNREMNREKELEQRIERLEKLIKQSGEFIDAIESDEPDIKEGDWVYAKRDDDIAIMNINNDWGGFGFYNGEWLSGENTSITYFKNFGYDVLRKATKDEIEKALIKEAERRGFPVESWTHPNKKDSVFSNAGLNRLFEYDPKQDILFLNGGVVYKQGDWSEIVETTKFFDWDVEINEDSVVFAPGCEAFVFDKEVLKNLMPALDYVKDKTGKQILNELIKLKIWKDR